MRASRSARGARGVCVSVRMRAARTADKVLARRERLVDALAQGVGCLGAILQPSDERHQQLLCQNRILTIRFLPTSPPAQHADG